MLTFKQRYKQLVEERNKQGRHVVQKINEEKLKERNLQRDSQEFDDCIESKKIGIIKSRNTTNSKADFQRPNQKINDAGTYMKPRSNNNINISEFISTAHREFDEVGFKNDEQILPMEPYGAIATVECTNDTILKRNILSFESKNINKSVVNVDYTQEASKDTSFSIKDLDHMEHRPKMKVDFSMSKDSRTMENMLQREASESHHS